MNENEKPKSDRHIAKHKNGNIHITVNNSQPAVNVGVLERDWLTALLLSIFLGWLGADAFYLGRTGKGILKLFTLGLFGILWVIDVIMIATRSVNNVVWKEGRPHMQGQGSNNSTNWFARHKVLTAVLAILLIAGIASAASGGNKKTESGFQTQNTTSNTPTQNTQAKPVAQPAKAKAWVQVVTFSGDSAKRSEPFTLTGADAKLKYTQTGSQYGTTYVYIVKKGDSLEKSGGFPETTITGDKTDETRLAKAAGDYYFDVNSSSTSWTITIEEYR